MELRALKRSEIEQVWTIDRSEIIENIYVLLDGKLVLQPHYFDVPGWEDGEAEKYTPLLQASFDRGGQFFGFFDGDKVAGVGAVDTIWRGPKQELLQLTFLHVSNAYRGQRLGVRLFEHCKDVARDMGAKGLYVSAIPSENTVDFYRRLRCVVTETPDAELSALEPEDIPLECLFK
ncbi:GNAT family N-acetyltransferase [Phyllobacterium sp. 628]|uniref:GNAT family N-acetyltransferase n=1 Tax=Phyllobacterium sp. 628 TaxID=2718938 RepID=UPI0016626597|nr:GNAT family N-acetyltransferase [Phyllobacterium sp. 628]QND51966.1 GNAT family N-acetyltransferase [Phyllobacterium sp. 628]